MSTINDPFPSPDPAAPVFRPGEFKGREGVVRNMLRRLARGESLSIVGGPKLGKTSLLLHLAWHLNHADSSQKSSELSAVYVDLTDETDCQQFQSRSQESRTIFLLDNCDKLVEGKTFSLSDMDLSRNGPTVFAGMRAWRDVVSGSRLAQQLKSIPLAVFLEKEAQQLISPDLTPEQQACVLTYAGTHPFIIKIFQAAVLREGSHVRLASLVNDVKTFLFSFFQNCANQLREPLEHQVLAYLIEANKPVNPGVIAQAVGRSTIKPIADTLCSMGLVARWIREEEAALSAHIQLFNEWYRETVMASNSSSMTF